MGAGCNCRLLVLRQELARWFWDVEEVMVETEAVDKALQLCLQTVDTCDAGQEIHGQTGMDASAFNSCTMQHC